jgi:cytoskeleton protein RodZ
MNNRNAEVSAIEQSVINALGMETAGIEPIGETLRNTREAANLSLRQVADKMFLLPGQVEALEAGDKGRFRGDFFYRGYLRSYAKLMKLDPQVIIDGCDRENSVNTETVRAKMDHQHIQSPRKGRSIKYWFLAIVVLVGYFLWWESTEEEVQELTGTHLTAGDGNNHVDELGATASSSVQKLAIGSTNDQGFLVAGDREILREDGPIREQNAIVSFVSTDKITEAAVVTLIEKGMTESAPGRTSGLAASDIKGEGGLFDSELAQNSLDFNFINDCWVEVRDRDNKIIFSDLKRAEETLNLLGRAPFSILLGFAPGVSLAYNGKPINILIDKSNNSARLTVGRS